MNISLLALHILCVTAFFYPLIHHLITSEDPSFHGNIRLEREREGGGEGKGGDRQV